MRDRVAYAAVTLLGLALMLYLLWQVKEPIRTARNDFLPLYVAGKLAGTGDLYDPHAYYAFMIQRFAALHESLRFTRLPFYAVLLWPLSLLSYKTAYGVWWLLRIAALGAFVALWRIPSRADAALFTVLSLPVFASLAAGQDSILLLLFIAVAFRDWERGNDYRGGLALSLCAIKFHLFVLLPLLLWRQRLSRMAAGFGTGAAALAGVSFAVEGWRWPLEYFGVLTDGRVHPGPDTMPNLHGLFAALPHGAYLEIAAALAVVAAAWVTLRAVAFPSGFALTLLGGLLLSFHSYMMDAAILLPALLIVMAGTTRRSLKIAGALLLSPPAALLLVSHPPWSYLTQAGLAAFYFAAAGDLRSGPRAAQMDHSRPRPIPQTADPQVSLNHSPM
jgi:Glycosyltransferase family 87